MTSTALVYGLAISGEAVARALHDRGVRVLVADDAPDDAKFAAAASFGAELVAKPDAAMIDRLVSSADIICPAPGVPETHSVIEAADRHGTPIRVDRRPRQRRRCLCRRVQQLPTQLDRQLQE